MQNVFRSLIVTCMYFSIVVVTIPIYADNQDYGEILTVGYHLPPPLINLNPPEIYPEPKITDIEGENFKLYSHEFFTIKIPENFVPDNSSGFCQLHDQLCNYGRFIRNPLPEDATEYDNGKKNQYMYIKFEPYSRYTNTLDLTNDASFDVPYIHDELQQIPFVSKGIAVAKKVLNTYCNSEESVYSVCKNLSVTDLRFMKINGMPAYQVEYEFDYKQPSPYSTEHYKYDEETDKKLRVFEHVSELQTTIFTKGFKVYIYTLSTHEDYLENPATWEELKDATHSFDTINNVHKITDNTVFDTINYQLDNISDVIVIGSPINYLNQT